VALTLARVSDFEHVAWGNKIATAWDLTPDDSYPAGGYEVLPADVGLGKIEGAIFIGSVIADIMPIWVVSTGKFALLVPSTGAEATGDQDANTFRAIFLGEP
jgi:hypothetical protein